MLALNGNIFFKRFSQSCYYSASFSAFSLLASFCHAGHDTYSSSLGCLLGFPSQDGSCLVGSPLEVIDIGMGGTMRDSRTRRLPFLHLSPFLSRPVLHSECEPFLQSFLGEITDCLLTPVAVKNPTAYPRHNQQMHSHNLRIAPCHVRLSRLRVPNDPGDTAIRPAASVIFRVTKVSHGAQIRD